MLLSTSDIVARWQIRNNLLSCPATVKDPGSGIAETPAKVGNYPIVCALSSEIVGLLEIELVVCSSLVLSAEFRLVK
jgi:hypothetical protein